MADFDKTRIIKKMMCGSFFAGPLLHFWFSKGIPFIITKFLPSKFSYFKLLTKRKIILASIFFDQLFFSVFFNINFSIINSFLFNGKNFKESVKLSKNNIWSIMKKNWKYWPFVQFINFSIIPMNFKVLWVNIFGIIWNLYLLSIA